MSANEIELAAVEKAKKLIDKVIEAAAQKVGEKLNDVAISSLASLVGYKNYLAETNDRVSKFKTFANPAVSVELLDNFVQMNLENGHEEIINSTDLIESMPDNRKIVISASAGFGKSILMRYMSLCFYESPRGKIPIFIELRELNRITSPNIIGYIHTIYKKQSKIEQEAFVQGMKAGVFLFIFDGFDELNFEIRNDVESQILSISQNYRNCSMAISGRPNEKFESWREFEIFRVCPMNKSAVINLIRNLDYDSGTKRRFIKKLNDGLFESHHSFLSTPLLAILMLLNFQENAHIPDKMHIFYGKAFETLFHKHDALKEQYERQRKSGLRIDEFSRVFSVFCLSSYVREDLEFLESDILEIISKALQYFGSNANPQDFLDDITNSVCLIQREGLIYHFVHRSFQEYFTALFLSKCSLEVRDNFIDEVANRYWDNVLPMLFDMASEQLEPTWVKEKVTEYLEIVDNFSKSNQFVEIVKLHWGGIALLKDNDSSQPEFAALLQGDWYKTIGIIRRFYPEYFRKLDNIIDYDNFGKEFFSLFDISKTDGGSKYSSFIVHEITFENVHWEMIEKANIWRHIEMLNSVIQVIFEKCSKNLNDKGKFLDNLFSTAER